MATERASVFGDDDLDVSGFEPTKPSSRRPKPDPKEIRKAAESRGFQAREPVVEPTPAVVAQPRQQRRHVTGRNRQLNIKATEEAVQRFYALADRQGWVLGETFDRAISALEREMGQGRAGEH